MYYTVICRSPYTGDIYSVADTFTRKADAQACVDKIASVSSAYRCIIVQHKKPLRDLVIARGAVVAFSNGLRASVGEDQI